MNIFKKRKYISLSSEPKSTPVVPDGMWVKCPCCGKAIYKKELDEFRVCRHCHGYFRLTAQERIAITADENSFEEFDSNLSAKNPLNFPKYSEKIQALSESTGLNDAVVTGKCTIDGTETVLGVMDSEFLMGSMGSVVGEKITRAFEYAIEHRLPVVIFTVSGGARMQEGIISLMQMAKVSGAVAKHNERGLLYISVLTDPTTGGVTASFAMQGDIILAEPRALIGFAGPRVIEQTLKQKLPEGFQSSEFLLDHGFIDKIVKRQSLKKTLGTILNLHRVWM